MSLNLLKKAAKKYGQRVTAKKIGKSATTVNLLLKGTYPKPQKILQTVSEVFAYLESEEFECPVVGPLHIDVCKKYRVWSKQGKVHKDRIYAEVKNYCNECKHKEITND